MPNPRLVLILVIGIIFALFPQTEQLGSDGTLTLMITLFILASMALSWNILAGFVGQINLGHVAFFGLGSLVTRQLWINEEVDFALAFVAGGGAAALAAIVVGVPALRLRGVYFAVGTLALAEALRLTVSTILPRVSRLPGPALRSYELTPRYYLALGVMLVVLLAVFWLSRSRLGLGMMAIREDEGAARSIGINVFLHSLIAFVMSAFFAGLAGSAFAYFNPAYYHYEAFEPVRTFDGLLVTFVGGIGTLTGPFVGASFFVLSRDQLAGTESLQDVHRIIFGILFILVVLILPGGLVDFSTRVGNWIMKRRST